MSVIRKVGLGLCLVGAIGAGYYGGALVRSKPVNATVAVETAKPKTKTNISTPAVNTKPAGHVKDHARVRTYKHNQKPQSKTKKSIDLTPKSNANKVHRSTFAGTKTKTNRQRLYLTGKQTRQRYSRKQIKKANEIHQEHPDYSYARCLALSKERK